MIVSEIKVSSASNENIAEVMRDVMKNGLNKDLFSDIPREEFEPEWLNDILTGATLLCTLRYEGYLEMIFYSVRLGHYIDLRVYQDFHFDVAGYTVVERK